MATRNRTKEFLNFRESHRRDTGHRQQKDTRESEFGLLPQDDQDHVAIHMGVGNELPPEWVDIVESIQKDLQSVRDNLRALQKLHNQRLKVKFDDDEQAERDIEIMTQEITRLLRKCESGVKRIATVGNARGTNLPQQERTVRLNVMRNLATQMQSLSKQFRHAQKEFLMRLRGQEEVGREFFDDDMKGVSREDALDRGLSEEEMQALQMYEESADMRHQEIIRIATSINELATLFRELNVLVIEQGTILDRIDYNVEQTLTRVQKGTEELQKAEDYSKKARSMKCILLLLVVNIILSIILIAQHPPDTSSSDSSGNGGNGNGGNGGN